MKNYSSVPQPRRCPSNMYEDRWIEPNPIITNNPRILEIRKELDNSCCCEAHPVSQMWWMDKRDELKDQLEKSKQDQLEKLKQDQLEKSKKDK